MNSLRERARTIIERVFGEDSSYYERLSGIRFRRGGSVRIVSSFGGGSSETPAERQARKCARRSGQEQSIALIDVMLEDLEMREPEQVQGTEDLPVEKSDRVFVVHGHDEGMRESVARVLTKLGLEPVILHELPDRGRTIIEKFYEHSEVEFAVVLLSPDDTGYSNADAPERGTGARVLSGRLGRENVVALHTGDVEIPPDFSGVLYTPYNGDEA